MGGGLTRWQRAVRVCLVLLALTFEFLLVMRIYHLGDHVHAQEVAVARTSGALRAGGTPSRVAATVADVVATRAPDAAEIQARASAWSASGAASDRADLARSLRASEAAIVSARREVNRSAVLAFLCLFLFVCAGWFLWFGRLARRHRETQRRLTERQVLDAGERRLTALVHNSADLVLTLDGDSTVSFASAAAIRVLGRRPDELVGDRLLDAVEVEDRPTLTQLLAGTRPGETALTMRMHHPQSGTVIVEGVLSNLRDDPVVGSWVLTVRDVTERIRLEGELVHQAFHDSLTGLANRQLFHDRLAHALQRPSPTGRVSVLFVDIDDFKLVNDVLGHDVGDRILVVVSERISGALRDHDTVARLGGDEFAVLLDDTDEPAAVLAAQSVLDALREPITLAGVTHVLGASIGVAVTAVGEADDTEMLRNADAAMYLAKERGKGAYAVYDPSLHVRAMELLTTRIELRTAIADGELRLHYQPTVDLVTQTITGFEALVRWQHPERGLLPPSEFIGIAEQSGLIVGLGTWVLREACHAAQQLQTATHHPTMAVNVAAEQLCDPGFVDLVLDALRASGLPAHLLTLEITESAIIDDVDLGIEALGRLRGLGVRVAIDDFGTGYSSLSQLSRLPIDVLKLDKSFVDRLAGDGDTSVMEAILTMSEALALITVAEGVELDIQASWLRAHGSSLGQGYLWSRPVELASARRLLDQGVADHAGPDPLEARTA